MDKYSKIIVDPDPTIIDPTHELLTEILAQNRMIIEMLAKPEVKISSHEPARDEVDYARTDRMKEYPLDHPVAFKGIEG